MVNYFRTNHYKLLNFDDPLGTGASNISRSLVRIIDNALKKQREKQESKR